MKIIRLLLVSQTLAAASYGLRAMIIKESEESTSSVKISETVNILHVFDSPRPPNPIKFEGFKTHSVCDPRDVFILKKPKSFNNRSGCFSRPPKVLGNNYKQKSIPRHMCHIR